MYRSSNLKLNPSHNILLFYWLKFLWLIPEGTYKKSTPDMLGVSNFKTGKM